MQVTWQGAGLVVMKPWVQSLVLYKLGRMVHACNPSIQEVDRSNSSSRSPATTQRGQAQPEIQETLGEGGVGREGGWREGREREEERRRRENIGYNVQKVQHSAEHTLDAPQIVCIHKKASLGESSIVFLLVQYTVLFLCREKVQSKLVFLKFCAFVVFSWLLLDVDSFKAISKGKSSPECSMLRKGSCIHLHYD